MIVSRLVPKLTSCGVIPCKHAKKVATHISHIEHGGGVCVGLELIFPHFFSVGALAGLGVVFVLIRYLSTREGPDVEMQGLQQHGAGRES